MKLISESSNEEIIISKEDRHLCFRVGIYCSQPVDGWPPHKSVEKCGFVDTGKETLCPGLEIGSDKPVRVTRLDYVL